MDSYKVLIVDDESANIKMLSALLKDQYKVYAAKSGQQGIELAKNNKPDLILLDVIMPGDDGFTTIQQLKKDADVCDIPVIFITGLSSQKDEERGLMLGACDYIYKPFYPPVVLARITTQMKIIQQNRQLVNLTEQLRGASEAKGAFLANMSHEIRTPLTTIIGYAEALKQGEIIEKNQAVNTIHSSAKHLLCLINDILDFSKIEAGQLAIEMIEIDLAALIAELKNMSLELIKDKNIVFNIEFFTAMPRKMMSDPTRLKQILLNLLSNAIKFTDTGTIKLILQHKGNVLYFTISDTGIGIPENKISHLFSQFSQLDTSTTRQYGGTGLGLSISQTLANKLGGDIKVTSEVNKGSQFTASITYQPINEITDFINHSDDITASVDTLMFDSAPLKGHVLLAEDHPQNQRLFKFILAGFGLTVDSVDNGEQAVEMAMLNEYDAILMDIQMPKMDGPSALRLLRNAGCDIPIIALTANVLSVDVEKYLTMSFDQHCAKPIDKVDLYQKLKLYLSAENSSDTFSVIEKNMAENIDNLALSFQAEFPNYLTQLVDIELKQDRQALARLCHYIRGAAASYHFEPLAQLTHKIEIAVEAKEDNVFQQLDALKQQLLVNKNT